jgi:L-ribulose-5-phosphate 3-epimerase
VTSVLIMIDREGNLGDPDEERRKTSVENHHKWVEAAAYLGCHSIRVNARSRGEYDEQMKLAADGLYALCEYGDQYNINVIVENHGGLSSNGKWLTGVMEMVNHPRCGTLPDFGNFMVSREEEYDRYLGVTELMKYAKGVSAKSHEFDEDGNETETDFYKMLKIVKEAGYTGHIGIEYEGRGLSEFQGIWATKKLLEKAGAAV